MQSALDSVSFPLGRRMVSEKVPGVRMASILTLPNVGNAPTFELSFVTSGDGIVRSDRGANAISTLEAFWPSASVLDSSATGGQFALRYESPTRSSGRVAQSVDVRLCGSEGGAASGDDDSWLVSEVFQQDNIEQVWNHRMPTRRAHPDMATATLMRVPRAWFAEQGIRGQYQVLSVYRRLPSQPGLVRCRQRVAAYLQPADSAFFDAQGKPVVLYDYSYTMKRLRDEARSNLT